MATFQKCDKTVIEMANGILKEFESHHPLVDAGVKIDFVFAFCDRDDEGNATNNALMLHGVKALGIARIIGTKDRAKGNGDAEICLDGDYWQETASEEQQRALLDHELHHISLKMVKKQLVHDDLGRPKIVMRKHTVQFGWFAVIAERHGKNSQEQIQAQLIMDSFGQYFLPQLADGNNSLAKRK